MVTKARPKAVEEAQLITDVERFEWAKNNHGDYVTLFGSVGAEGIDQAIDKKIQQAYAIARRTKEEAAALVKEKTAQLKEIYDELALLAVQHQIYVYAEGPSGYGSGASVALETRKNSWSNQTAGEWISSSDNC